MSVLSGKHVAETETETETADARDRVQQLAWVTVVARAAVPMAKTGGLAVRVGTRRAATWAAPRVNGARAWTAPRIERSGLAIKDTIAPKICETLTAAARRVDVTVPRAVDVAAPRRRWPKVVAGAAMLAAVGAAAAVVLRHRKNEETCGAPGEAAEAGTGPQAAQDGQVRAGPGGSGAEENVSGQSSAP